MDSFSERYTRIGDDISLEEVRQQVKALEDEHKANGVQLSGRIIHVCHYLPIIATLTNRAGVLSPPATPPPGKSAEVTPNSTAGDEQPAAADATTTQEASSATKDSPVWTLAPRYGHAAMISGINSLVETHEQLIIGWTGDIQSPTPGEHISAETVTDADKAALDDALRTYQPKESDRDLDDDKKTKYVPVWLDDKVAHGHYDGYCKQSEFLRCGNSLGASLIYL